LHGVKPHQTEALADSIQGCQSIIKLSLSYIDLSHDATLEHLVQLVEDSPTLTHLDLSWANLRPTGLVAISEAICTNPDKLTHLNLSYNPMGSAVVEDLLPSPAPPKEPQSPSGKRAKTGLEAGPPSP